MNKIFVTGPTGTQGFPIVKELLAALSPWRATLSSRS